MKAVKLFLCFFIFVISSIEAHIHYFPPCSCECPYQLYLGVEGGYKKLFNIPKYSYGFFGPALSGPATPAFTTEDHPDGAYFATSGGVRVLFQPCHILAPNALSLDVSGNFFQTSDKDNISIPAPGFITIPLGSNGSVTFALPTSGTMDRRYQYQLGRFDFFPTYCLKLCCLSLLFEPLFSFATSRLVESYGTNIFIPDVLNNISISQKLTTFYQDIGGGVGLGFPFCRNFEIFIRNAFYWTKASSHLKSVIASGPSAAFIVRPANDDLTSITWTYRGTAGINFHFCRFHLGVIGQYEYRDFIPSILNPQVSAIATFSLNNPLIQRGHALHSASIGGYGGINF